MPCTIVGKPAFNDPSMRPNTGFGMVTPGFFETFGVRMVRGRAFTEQDTASSVKVAVVNEEFVKRYFKDADPLRQRISVEQLIPGVTKLGPPVEWQIVGIYHNVRAGGLREDYPETHIPFWQIPWPGASIGVRTANDPAAMVKSIAAAVHSFDLEIAVAERSVYSCALRQLCGGCVAARSAWRLWCHVLLCSAAVARDSSAHGSGRQTGPSRCHHRP